MLKDDLLKSEMQRIGTINIVDNQFTIGLFDPAAGNYERCIYAYLVGDESLLTSRSRLRPDEWNSGDKIWLMELIAPTLEGSPKALENLLAELRQGAFAGRSFKVRLRDREGGPLRIINVNEKSEGGTRGEKFA